MRIQICPSNLVSGNDYGRLNAFSLDQQISAQDGPLPVWCFHGPGIGLVIWG